MKIIVSLVTLLSFLAFNATNVGAEEATDDVRTKATEAQATKTEVKSETEPKAEAAAEVKAKTATAKLIDANNKQIGEATLTQTFHGVLIRLDLSQLPPGVHAFHIHEKGKCDTPSFKSAGDHFNPFNEKHGFLDKEGKHAGDLPNIYVPESGSLTVETIAREATLEHTKGQILDADGAALVIHTGPDDYRTNPAGDAGERIACGIITASSMDTASR